jgi:hypothetical protein
VLAVGLAVALVVAVSGCGETIDAGDLETQLRAKLAPEGGTVECPGGQDVETGREFSCVLIAPDGSQSRIDVTLTDDKGGFEASERQ